jgi:hypothetical protein
LTENIGSQPSILLKLLDNKEIKFKAGEVVKTSERTALKAIFGKN